LVGIIKTDENWGSEELELRFTGTGREEFLNEADGEPFHKCQNPNCRRSLKAEAHGMEIEYSSKRLKGVGRPPRGRRSS